MKVYIKTFGCQLNYSDSEVLAGILKEKGYKLVSSEKQAQIIIINSCGVKGPTAHKVIDYAKKWSKKKIFMGGCLPSMLNVKEHLPQLTGIFDTNSVSKIDNILEKCKPKTTSKKKEKRLGKPLARINKKIGIIPISQGCLGDPCSYCSVKQARGDLKSYKLNDIIKEVKRAVDDGCIKIRLTAQDTGCWGMDLNKTLPELLKKVLEIEGKFEVWLGMTNPNYILKYLDEIVEIYKHPKMFKFLHIPLQSASNRILKKMKRKYTVAQFKKIVTKFRKEIPKMNIATDIIVGFPTETEKEFQKTLDLVEEINFEVLNISKFAPRPNTEAAKMEQFHPNEIKRRSKILTKLYKKLIGL